MPSLAISLDEETALADSRRRRVLNKGVVYLFFLALTNAITFTTIPAINLLRSCQGLGIDEDQCKLGFPGYNEAQKEAAQLSAAVMFAVYGANVLTTPLLGAIGDAYGRRLPMLFPGIASSVISLVYLLVPVSRFYTLALPLIFIACCGGSAYRAVDSMLADVTIDVSSEERAMLFATVDVARLIAFLIGPALGGILLGMLGQQLYALTASLGLVYIILVLCTFEETLDVARRHQLSWTRANPLGALRLFNAAPIMRALGCIIVAEEVARHGFSAVLGQYVLRLSGSSASIMGILLSTRAFFTVVGLVLLMPVVLTHLEFRQILMLSGSATVFSFGLHSMTTATWQLFALMPFASLIALIDPVLRTGITNFFGEARYGESLAALACLETLTAALASPLLNYVYSVTAGTEFTFSNGIGIHCVAFAVCTGVACLTVIAAYRIGEFPHSRSFQK